MASPTFFTNQDRDRDGLPDLSCPYLQGRHLSTNKFQKDSERGALRWRMSVCACKSEMARKRDCGCYCKKIVVDERGASEFEKKKLRVHVCVCESVCVRK